MKYTLRKLFDNEPMPESQKVQKAKGKNLIAFPEEYIVLDIETTGLNPSFCEIIELSALRVKNGKIEEEFNSLVKAKSKISPFITNLTGINAKMLEDAPDIKDAVKDFHNFCYGQIILGHNVTFDIRFIDTKLKKHHSTPFDNDYIDTLRIARILLPQLSNKKLGTIASFFGFNTQGMHRGLKDCKVTYQCYEKFKEMIIEKHGSLQNFPVK